jgi:hypothetical protein
MHACEADPGLDVGGEDTVAVGDQKTVRDGGPDGAGKLLGANPQSAGEDDGDESERDEDDEFA